MKKLLTGLLLVLLSETKTFANPACAVCTVAVGASLGIARKLGVDDSIVGLWAGAMLALIGYWTIRFFEKRKWNFKFRDPIIMAASVGMIGFMYVSEMAYNPEPIFFFWIDPFLLSALIGAAVLILSSNFYQWMKAKNGGHAHFPFEKVAVPVLALFIASVILYFYPLCASVSVEGLLK